MQKNRALEGSIRKIDQKWQRFEAKEYKRIQNQNCNARRGMAILNKTMIKDYNELPMTNENI